MSKYKRRVVITSIAIHFVALLGIFTYWILNPNLDIAKKNNNPAPENNFVKGSDTNQPNSFDQDNPPETGKDPKQDYEQGDLSDSQLRDMLNTQMQKNLSAQQKAEQLNSKFDALATSPVKHVEEASDTVLNALGVKKNNSKQPMRKHDLIGKNKVKVDINSLRLYDYEIIDDKYALIYKDKNNVYIKNDPVALSSLDEHDKQLIGQYGRCR